MSDHIHTWYSVRTADGKMDFDQRSDAEAYVDGLDIDWTLVRVEVLVLDTNNPHEAPKVSTWALGGSGTLAEADSGGPEWSARSGEQEVRSGTR